MMRQRFVDEFRLYKDKLFTDIERDHFHCHRANDTLGDLYFRVVEMICTKVVAYMTWFHSEETATRVADVKNASQIGKRVPLSTVHALYKMKEYYVPVYDAVSYDVELLCIACKLRPVYRPCTRLAKKACCQRFKSRCLQCCVEYELTVAGGETVLGAFCLSTIELERRCHRYYMTLLFPSFMLFASESSIKMVLRVCLKNTVADMISKAGDRSVMTVRIDSRIAGRGSSGDSSTLERKQYVDRQYFYQVVSDYATDHFMICVGICSEKQSILRIPWCVKQDVSGT